MRIAEDLPEGLAERLELLQRLFLLSRLPIVEEVPLQSLQITDITVQTRRIHEVAVDEVKVLQDDVAPVDEVIKGLDLLGRAYLAVGLVELEELRRPIQHTALGYEATDELAHRAELGGEDRPLARELSEVVTEEALGALGREDEEVTVEVLGEEVRGDLL